MANNQPLPSWYLPEDAEQPDSAQPQQPAASPTSSQQPYSVGFQQMDAQRAAAARANAGAPTSTSRPLPSWYTPEPDSQAPTPQASGPLPAWYTPEVADGSPSTPQPPAENWRSLGESALGEIPGAVLGAPRALLVDLPAWTAAKIDNAISGGNKTTAEVEAEQRARNPYGVSSALQAVLPSTEGVNNAVFHAAGAAPYQARTPAGQIASAAITAGGAGLVDPLALAGDARNAGTVVSAIARTLGTSAKTAAAGVAASGAQQLFPDSDIAPVAAALAAHTGLSGVSRAVATGGGAVDDAARQVFTPTAQGVREAGRTLASVDNTLPALAQPSDTDLSGAQSNVVSATGDIGPGLEPWQAGSQLRNDLQTRVDNLKASRTAATAPLAEARDNSPWPVDLDPVFNLIGSKLNVAAGAQQDALQGARSDLHLADGSVREDAQQIAAARQAINARITAASRAGDAATATHLLDVRNALDTQVSNAVPEAGQFNETYATLSRPLDPMQYGPVGKVLDRDQYNSRYTFPDERIPDLFLRSSATRSDLNQLVDAFGGDKDAATSALEQHLAGVAQRAVNPDGTFDANAFDRAMAPYNKAMNGNMGFWFPQLAQKFANAKVAQSTLDTMNSQRALANDIENGALRDGTGAVTGQSFSKWLATNKDMLARTQSPAAVMRLQSIASALQQPPGVLADAIKSEILPTAVGTALGGVEGGVLGNLLHRATGAAFGGLDARRQAAFNTAIERATLDPSYAASIAGKMSGYPRSISLTRALARAINATTFATNAANPAGGTN